MLLEACERHDILALRKIADQVRREKPELGAWLADQATEYEYEQIKQLAAAVAEGTGKRQEQQEPKVNILVVDDEPAQLDALVRVLQNLVRSVGSQARRSSCAAGAKGTA